MKSFICIKRLFCVIECNACIVDTDIAKLQISKCVFYIMHFFLTQKSGFGTIFSASYQCSAFNEI